MSVMQQDPRTTGPTSLKSNASPLFAFAGGGSGGHLYPALAIATALRECLGDCRTVFYGTHRAIDKRVLDYAGEHLVAQQVIPPSVRPWRWPGFLAALRASIRDCRVRFRAQRPDFVLGTGGYASVPPVLAAREMGIATALLNPDLLPGRANRFLARRVDCVFAQFLETHDHFASKVRVEALGCPVRAVFETAAGNSRTAMMARFGLTAGRRTLLVTGASLGARSINTAMVRLAGQLARYHDWQILHVSGPHDGALLTSAYQQAGVSAKVLDYTEDMAEAMSLCDLMVTRAGASTIAEVLAVGVPTVLLPYPHHRDQHQLAHARWLESRGAGVACPGLGVEPDAEQRFAETLGQLMGDPDRCAAMRRTVRALRPHNAAQAIARRMIEMTGCSVPREQGRMAG